KRERKCHILKSKIVGRCNRTTNSPCSTINFLVRSKVRPSDTRKEDARMTCTQCHTQNKTGRQYCASCGQRLSHACTQCAFLNDPGDRFCGGCGTPLAWPPPSDINTTVIASPISSLAFASAPRRDERISDEPSGLSVQNLIGDERKIVTALFADL